MGPLTLAAAKPRSTPFPAGEVHLWMVALEVAIERSRPLLDPAEQARASGYRQGAAGARFAASRAGLRRIVAGYLDADPASLCFQPGRSGKPAAAIHVSARDAGPGDHATGRGCEVLPGFEFSLARTEEVALVAVSATPVGADIERITPRPGLPDLVATRFPPREAACIEAGCGVPAGPDHPDDLGGPGEPGDRWLRGFYRHWTAREAHLKALGCGLSGLRRVEVSCRPRAAVWFCGAPADGWKLSFPAISPAHIGAVVARDPVTRCEWLPA